MMSTRDRSKSPVPGAQAAALDLTDGGGGGSDLDV